MAVLSNNDGCIVARSNEIKALGIPMGVPMFQYKELLEKKEQLFSLLITNYMAICLKGLWRPTAIHLPVHGSIFNR